MCYQDTNICKIIMLLFHAINIALKLISGCSSMKLATSLIHNTVLNIMVALWNRHVVCKMGYVREIPYQSQLTSQQRYILTSTRLSFTLLVLQTNRINNWNTWKSVFMFFLLKCGFEMWWKFWLCTGQLKSQLFYVQCSGTGHLLTIVQLFCGIICVSMG